MNVVVWLPDDFRQLTPLFQYMAFCVSAAAKLRQFDWCSKFSWLIFFVFMPFFILFVIFVSDFCYLCCSNLGQWGHGMLFAILSLSSSSSPGGFIGCCKAFIPYSPCFSDTKTCWQLISILSRPFSPLSASWCGSTGWHMLYITHIFYII